MDNLIAVACLVIIAVVYHLVVGIDVRPVRRRK